MQDMEGGEHNRIVDGYGATQNEPQGNHLPQVHDRN